MNPLAVYELNDDPLYVAEVPSTKFFKCRLCQIKFKDIEDLLNHITNVHQINMQMSEGAWLFSCLICKKAFTNVNNIIKHWEKCKSNPKKLWLSCLICKKAFTNVNNTIKHCEKCKSNPKQLWPAASTVEIDTRTGEIRNSSDHNSVPINTLPESISKETYGCDKCHYEFSSLDLLLVHKNTADYKQNSKFTCNICSKLWFSCNRNFLELHLDTVHKQGNTSVPQHISPENVIDMGMQILEEHVVEPPNKSRKRQPQPENSVPNTGDNTTDHNYYQNNTTDLGNNPSLVSKLNQEIFDLKYANENLRQEIAQLVATNSTLSKNLQEGNDVENIISSCHEENKENVNELRDVVKKYHEENQEKLKELTKLYLGLKQQQPENVVVLNRIESSLEEGKNKLNEKIITLDNEIIDLKEANRSLKQVNDNLQNENAKMFDLKNKNDQLKAEHSKLIIALNNFNVIKDTVIDKMQEEINDLKAILENESNAKQDLKIKIQENEKLKNDNEMLGKEIANLKTNFEVETTKNVQLGQENEKLKNDNENLKANLAVEASKNVNLFARLDANGLAIKNLKEENGTLTDQLKNLNENFEVKTSTIAKFQQNIRNLNQEIETLNKNNETLKEEVNDSKQKYSIQLKNSETLKSQHNILMDILTISDDKRNFLSLREELECLKNFYVQEKERAESLGLRTFPTSENEDLVEKYAEANEEIKVLKEKLIESETNSSHHEQEIGRLKLENEDLNKKFGVFGYLFKK